jgi:galactokinase
VNGARTVSEWKKLFAERGGPVDRRLAEIYGRDPARLERRLPLWNAALDGFAAAFSPRARVIIARSTGRVNLLGMHIDHRGGAVNTLGVGDTILVAELRDDDRVVLRNLDERYEPREFSIGEELPRDRIRDWDAWTMDRHAERAEAGTAADWSNYVRAAVLYLQHLSTREDGTFSPALRGMNLFVGGNLEASAGLSSSSSIVVGCMDACIHLNDLGISDQEMADHCHLAEWYVGTRGGGGDHAAIKFARRGFLTHIGSFPLSVELLPLPEGCCAVLCNSLVVAAKTAGARDTFNQRVAGYELGLLLLRKRFPQRTARLEHLRDVNPGSLGVDEGEIYQMLKALPESAGREELAAELADHPGDLERIFRSHAPPAEGYRLRQVCLYGIAECLRSERAVELLQSGDATGFGELITISHDGDRVSRRTPGGDRAPLAKPLGDADLDRLTAQVRSDDPGTREEARLHRQPGGYDVSCPELDEMVDIAVEVPGVLGAGLVGAGLGGCMVALARDRSAQRVVAELEERYYRPRNLAVTAQVCEGVGGACVLQPE